MNRPLAIVTGGRRGIGLGIAKALAVAGFDIAPTGLDANGMADPALDEIRALGVEAFYAQSDLADLSTHGPAVDAILGRFGRIDCLVNNAGMASVVRGDFLDLTPENYDRILATNLRGTVFFTQAVVKAMLGRPEGDTYRSIINITSVSASLSSPERLDYCISKTGLAAFSQGLALRLAEDG
ncbi:MAG: 3-ketoacyl-ACP reductase, partial [Rhizobiales bacterium 63-7]